MSSELKYTPVKEIPTLVNNCRAHFRSGKTLPIAGRLANLHKVIKMIDEYQQPLQAAVWKDLHKPAEEFEIMEMAMVRNEAWEAISHLRDWTAPQHVPKEGVHRLDTAYTLADPKGVVLIISAFNYPMQLALAPLVGAIAAGCTVVLKCSELSPNTAALCTEMIEKYFPKELVACVNGGIEESSALLAQKFDHITYTGSGRVGRIVMAAAAKNLTSVTLELGGKSPCFIDASANIPVCARRVAWGRNVNAGQTCIAPDYLLVDPTVKQQFLDEYKKAIKAFWGDDVKASKDYCRIVNDMHFKRVKGLIEGGGKVVVGGSTDPSTKYIEPTVLDNVNPDKDACMQEEIFGPVLPIVDCKSVDEAVEFINDRDKPLAMYIFSTDTRVQNELLRRTSAGGVTINDTLMHAANPCLPFGGVGPSGCGAYHGKRTFDMFSHDKAVLIKAAGLEFANDVRYPAYNASKLGLLNRLMVLNGPKSNTLFYFVLGAVATAAVAFYWQYRKKLGLTGLF